MHIDSFEPKRFFFTDRQRVADPLKAVEGLLPGVGVVFRDYESPHRAQLAHAVSKVARETRRALYVAGSPELAHRVRAIGTHLPEHQLGNAVRIKQQFPHLKISAACHSLPSILRACRLPIDLMFLSPVFFTESHRDSDPLGILQFSSITTQATTATAGRVRIYALGGIHRGNVDRLRTSGAHGYAAIGMFLEKS